MNLAPEVQRDFEALPPALRALLQAELAAGNAIIEVGHSFPAPPAGAYFKLATRVSTRARAAGDGLFFCDRNNSYCAGEFTDAERFYFILEPPPPPPPAPNTDAIRAERNHREAAAGVPPTTTATPPQVTAPPPARTAVDRFRDSMVMNYERWHDGTGYDLALLQTATPAERAEIEHLLTSREVHDWREVAALAALDSPRARACLRTVLNHGRNELALAVLAYAPNLVAATKRTTVLVAALEHGDFHTGLTAALNQVERFHPPEIVAALWRGVLHRPGPQAVHFAALLMFLHGQASAAFAWELRPFFLTFNTENQAERAICFRELCARCQVDPEKYLAP